MRVFVDPLPQTLGRAMYRVADALYRYAPRDVQVVANPEEADVQVLHAIGPDVVRELKAPNFALLQYCLSSAEHAEEHSAAKAATKCLMKMASEMR